MLSTKRSEMENQSYNPKKALAALLNDADRSAFTEIRNELAGVEKQLADLECQGEDTGNARAAAYELDYRVNCTVDVGAVKAARDHLQKAVARRHPASVLA